MMRTRGTPIMLRVDEAVLCSACNQLSNTTSETCPCGSTGSLVNLAWMLESRARRMIDTHAAYAETTAEGLTIYSAVDDLAIFTLRRTRALEGSTS